MPIKIIIALLAVLLASCSTQLPPMPMPAPMPCDVKVKGECHRMSSSEKGGAVTRGHTETFKEPL